MSTSAVTQPPVVRGPVRRGRKTKLLVKRLQPGEIAVIAHRNLDRVSAEDLIACGVAAVLNCRTSAADDYPNMGPVLLVQAGIPLIELPDDAVFDELRDGDAVEIHGGTVQSGRRVISQGVVQDPAEVLAANERRRQEIGGALAAFAENTVQHMVEEQDLLSGKIDLPRFETSFRDRHVLIVVRGVDHQADLQALRPYIRDIRPVLVGVDGGADAIIDAGFRPDMIVGDMDSASERALCCGAELIVHAYADGRAPGRELLQKLDLPHKLIPAPGTSQDIAMLIAAEKGAELIVAVGSQFNLVEFLDKNRRGMSSTFLTRQRLGERIVDAKGVSRLYRPGPGLVPVAFVLGAGVLVLIAVVFATPGLHDVVDLLWLKLRVLLGGAP